MNLTHLVLFHFWAGASELAAPSPGIHSPFIQLGALGTFAIWALAQEQWTAEVGALSTFDILWIMVPSSFKHEVSSDSSFTILLEVK